MTAPYSSSAKWALILNRDERLFFNFLILPTVGLVLWFMTLLISKDIQLAGVIIVLVLCCAPYFIWRSYWRTRNAIIAENKEDYHRSLLLANVLEKFATSNATDFPVSETTIRDGWKPFRIEHAISNSLKAEMSGSLRGGLFGPGSMSGTIDGVNIPNLLDTSSILFLKGPKGTLRALIPSPRATRELLAQILEQWVNGSKRDSHTREVLRGFAIGKDKLLEPISHPGFIDELDASCEVPLEERPTVKVVGTQIQEGVVLVTVLEVNGEKAVFLPSGFFRELSAEVSKLIGARETPAITSVLNSV